MWKTALQAQEFEVSPQRFSCSNMSSWQRSHVFFLRICRSRSLKCGGRIPECSDDHRDRSFTQLLVFWFRSSHSSISSSSFFLLSLQIPTSIMSSIIFFLFMVEVIRVSLIKVRYDELAKNSCPSLAITANHSLLGVVTSDLSCGYILLSVSSSYTFKVCSFS